jgi:hypothetical protein
MESLAAIYGLTFICLHVQLACDGHHISTIST